MRVLVTGGAGFIGSHLADALATRGDDVAVVDDLSAGRPGRLSDQLALHKLSITDAAQLGAVVSDFRPELICHLAGQIEIHASVAAPTRDAQVTVAGTVGVLEAARAVRARVLFSSTGGALYGRDAPIPSLEDVLPLPESPHGVAKHSAEQYVELYNRLHGTGHGVLRLANVYGPRQEPGGAAGVIAIFCAQVLAGQRPVIFGDGLQTRDYVYVADAVQAFLAAADRGRPGTWNIGSGAEVSVLELAKLIGELAGRPVNPVFAPARQGDLLRSALAPDRAARELGWTAATPLAEGVARVYQWIEAGAPERSGW
ncbi:MAG TPA: NAD-dependent epimerase/dehydratase family protein [Streptosporangiaceae bacterium]